MFLVPLGHLPLVHGESQKPKEAVQYLDNGKVRVGFDLGKGGAITFLSHRGGPNMVNDCDLGRQIQMSYYSGPVPFQPTGAQLAPTWAGLGWNPIQSGDTFGHSSSMVAFRKGRDWAYLKCIPMHWPLNNVPAECTFESNVCLRGDTVEVRNRIRLARTDQTQYEGRTQELPAVYTNGPWYQILTYTGGQPFSSQPTTEIPHSFPWHSFQATENWTALLDEGGQGLGVWSPGTEQFSAGFFGPPGSGGSSDSPTGYIAPNETDILDWNGVYENRYVLILGSLDEIRGYVYRHSRKLELPRYVFRRDRQHWTYASCVDGGWPIRGEISLRLEAEDPQIVGPLGFWDSTKGPTVVIEAACRCHNPIAQLFWGRLDSPGFSESRSVHFNLISDGRYRKYRVQLSDSPEYRGIINRLRFDPEPSGAPGDWIKIRSIIVDSGN
jgi:hypothetical protein